MAKPGGLFGAQPATAPKQPPDVVKGIVDDVDKWMKSKMWSLSCYGFTMYGPCLPGLVDIHPDEIRAEAYQHRLPNGQLNRNYNSVFLARQQEQLALRARLQKCLDGSDPTDRRHLEEFVAGYYRPKGDAKTHISKPTSQNAASFSFSNAANRLQQQQQIQQQQQPQTLFATKPTSTAEPSVGFSFKAAAAASTNSPSLFGSTPAPPAAASSNSQSLFSSTSAATTAAATNSQSLFGSTPTPAATPPASASVGPSPAPASTSAALPSTSTGMVKQLGGSTKIFGTAQEPAKASPQDDCRYSALKDLTPEQLQLFEADEFPFMSVPHIPPPKELCRKMI